VHAVGDVQRDARRLLHNGAHSGMAVGPRDQDPAVLPEARRFRPSRAFRAVPRWQARGRRRRWRQQPPKGTTASLLPPSAQCGKKGAEPRDHPPHCKTTGQSAAPRTANRRRWRGSEERQGLMRPTTHSILSAVAVAFTPRAPCAAAAGAAAVVAATNPWVRPYKIKAGISRVFDPKIPGRPGYRWVLASRKRFTRDFEAPRRANREKTGKIRAET